MDMDKVIKKAIKHKENQLTGEDLIYQRSWEAIESIIENKENKFKRIVSNIFKKKFTIYMGETVAVLAFILLLVLVPTLSRGNSKHEKVISPTNQIQQPQKQEPHHEGQEPQTEKQQSQPEKQEQKNEKQETQKVESGEFIIYGGNIDTYEKEVIGKIGDSKGEKVEEKLATIANKLSEMKFNRLPIEVLKIETIDGKRIAKINLKEDSKNEKGWAKLYMQGSAGGTITSVSLIETFLQKEYKGEWIDGVEFLLEGKKCDFQHAPDLENVVYRK